MEFWGVEVKSGEPCSVKKGEGKILHLSQACLGEVNKDQGSKSIRVYITVDGKKLVLGTLSPEKFHQQLFNLVLDRDFELSHNWENASVFFYGCSVNDSCANSENGKTAKTMNADSAAPKQKMKEVEPKKVVKTLEEEDSSEEEDGYTNSSSDFSSDSDTDSDVSFSDSESVEGETESDDDEEEEAPKKVEQGKKRPADSAIEKPGPDKKAKLVTPQMTDAKKGGGGHVATPHPAKQAGRTPGTQSKQQTPKSAGSHPCKSCNNYLERFFKGVAEPKL